MKRHGTNTNVAWTQYSVDLSQKTYDQKLASIAEIREEVRLKSEQLAKEKRKVRGTLWDHYNKKLSKRSVSTNDQSGRRVRKTVVSRILWKHPSWMGMS